MALRVLVDPLHRIGLQRQVVLDRDAPDEDDDARDRERDRARRLAAGRGTRRAARAGPRGSPCRSSASGARGCRGSRAAGRSSTRQIAAMPTASSRPKSRIIGTLAKRSASEREDRVERDDEQRGPEVARRLLDRVLAAVEDRFLLDARVHLDRVVDADAEHHGQAGDGDDRERDPEVAREPERPDDADEDHEQRQQPPAHVEQHEQDHDHDRDRDAAEREHPAAQVVVDVLQQDRRAGGDDASRSRTTSLSACASTRSAAAPSLSIDSLPGAAR